MITGVFPANTTPVFSSTRMQSSPFIKRAQANLKHIPGLVDKSQNSNNERIVRDNKIFVFHRINSKYRKGGTHWIVHIKKA